MNRCSLIGIDFVRYRIEVMIIIATMMTGKGDPTLTRDAMLGDHDSKGTVGLRY